MTATAVRMTGREMQAGIIDTARLAGFKVAHFRPAMTKHGWRTPVQADGAGFPDLLLAHPDRGIWAIEIKGTGDRLRPDQQAWLDLLAAAGARALVVTPRDYDQLLHEISHPDA